MFFVVVKRPYYPLLTGVVAHCLMIVPTHTNDSICMPLDWEYGGGAVIARRLWWKYMGSRPFNILEIDLFIDKFLSYEFIYSGTEEVVIVGACQ